MRHVGFLAVTLLLPFSVFAAQSDLDQMRVDMIVKAFNSKPNEFVEPITASEVKIKNGVGRADLNKKVKYSYYINTERPSDPKSPIVMIPMATSRYAPTYYQTDEWWDAHKAELDAAKRNGTQAPRQDSKEVAAWLKENKLSTNPLVFKINENKIVETQRLQDFLYDYYEKNFAKDGKITLYRGGEKETETQDWLRGVRPRGVRYWSPTANYAWRYARKNNNFMNDLLDGKPPIYVFELSMQEFWRLTHEGRYPDLTLGTELTKLAHRNFDSRGVFTDDLSGGKDYMGIGKLGVEFELRSNSAGAKAMTPHFKRAITIEELVKDRVQIIRDTAERLVKMRPTEEGDIRKDFLARERQTILEGKIIYAVQNKLSQPTITELLDQWKPGRPSQEITDTFSGSDFRALVLTKAENAPKDSLNKAAELQHLEDVFLPRLMCSKVFGG